MRGSSVGERLPLLLPLLFLLAAPLAQAQPSIDEPADFYGANVLPEQGSVHLEFQGAANVPVTVEDVSGPRQSSDQGSPREQGRILFDTEIVADDPSGWAASVGRTFVQTQPGDVHELTLNIQSAATIQDPVVEVRLQATYLTPSGGEEVTNASVLAVAESFPRLSMEMAGLPADFSPDESQQISLTVTNENYYPDMVSFHVRGPEGWLVSPPSSIRLAPGETKTILIDVRPPDNPWFLYTTQSEFVAIDAVSETNGATLVTVGVPVTITGSNFPSWAAPHLLMLLIGAAAIVKRRRRKRADRKLEKGKPSYPGLDPEHEAELEALKIEDPERAESLETRLEVLYARRKDAWKQAYEQRKETEQTLQEAYSERHEALVAQREQGGREALRRRRELLERKRRLLERKREALGGSGAQAASEASDDADEGR